MMTTTTTTTMMMMMWLEYKTLSFGEGDTALLLSLRRATYVFASCSMFMDEIFIIYRVEFSFELISETIWKSRTSGCKFYGKSAVKRTRTTQSSALECLWKGELCLFVFREQLCNKNVCWPHECSC